MNKSVLKVAVILPAYNEELTIAPTIEAFWRAMPDAEIIVVNNNSSDSTGRIANNTLESLAAHGRVINEPRQGKGNAIRRAFMNINADIYVMADADLTYPADSLSALIKPVVDGEVDMVVGDRLSEGHYARENTRSFHGFGNNLVKMLINFLFGSSLNDIMSGYRVFNRKFVKNYPILVEGFQLETDLTLHALDKRFRILEIPVPYKNRPPGSVSKLNTFRDGTRVVFTIAQILRYYRPLIFFSGTAAIIALAGGLAGLPVLDDWVREHYIHHVPLAILATGLEVVAVLMIAIGLILDSITHQEKRAFERDMLDE
jgi:glycosyltransferase involved in cell wall biosynthesis